MWFPPYFYFRFGPKALAGVVYRCRFWATVTSITVRPLPRDHSPLSPVSPLLSVALVYCGQTVGWIRMPLGMEVGFGPGDVVLDGNPAPPRKGAQQLAPHFSGHVYCGQMVAHVSNC